MTLLSDWVISGRIIMEAIFSNAMRMLGHGSSPANREVQGEIMTWCRY
jgi:hypothetical protein